MTKVNQETVNKQTTTGIGRPETDKQAESDMNHPRVTILMAVYNASGYLNQALDSLLVGQTLTDFEIIAVDDASTDDSLAILRRRAGEDSRLMVLSLPHNLGQAEARNLALRHAQGEYVCMVDADDWLSPDALECAVERFGQVPDADCVVFRLIHYMQSDGREELYPEPFPLDAVITGEEAFRLSLNWEIHGLYLVRRDIHLRYPYDTTCRLYSDDNTTRLHYLHSRRVAFCSGVYYYRKHEQSATSAITPQRFLYLDANLSMLQTLRREGVSEEIVRSYGLVRWYNYKALVRFYDLNASSFTPVERKAISQHLLQVHKTFGRRVPYPLFRLRELVGLVWHEYILHK